MSEQMDILSVIRSREESPVPVIAVLVDAETLAAMAKSPLYAPHMSISVNGAQLNLMGKPLISTPLIQGVGVFTDREALANVLE